MSCVSYLYTLGKTYIEVPIYKKKKYLYLLPLLNIVSLEYFEVQFILSATLLKLVTIMTTLIKNIIITGEL